MPNTVKIWHDDRAKRDKQWVVTVRRGAIVDHFGFETKDAAQTFKRGLRTKTPTSRKVTGKAK